jgi:hypothetical protein
VVNLVADGTCTTSPVVPQFSTPPREPPLSASLHSLHLAICNCLLDSPDWLRLPLCSPPLLTSFSHQNGRLLDGASLATSPSFFPPQRLRTLLHPPKHPSLQHRAHSPISTRDPPERAVSRCFFIQYSQGPQPIYPCSFGLLILFPSFSPPPGHDDTGFQRGRRRRPA